MSEVTDTKYIGQIILLNREYYEVVERVNIPGLYKQGWYAINLKTRMWAFVD